MPSNPTLTWVCRALRWPTFVPLALLATCAVWAAIGSWFVQRTVQFDLSVENAGRRWSLEWERATDGLPNGAWLDLGALHKEEETLEICPAGRRPHGSGAELWLYSAMPLERPEASIDLKAAIRSARPEDIAGSWVPFESGPGIVFYGPQDGLLRLRVPPGGILLHMARTPTSGQVRLRYADEERTLELGSLQVAPEYVMLERGAPPPGEKVTVRYALPAYRVRGLSLRFWDSAGARIHLQNARLEERVFAIRVKSRPLRFVHAGEALDELRLHPDSPEGTIYLAGKTDAGRTATLSGAGLLFTGLLALRALGAALAKVLAWPAFYDRPLCRIALGGVALVHVGWGLWAPFFLSEDSVDYLGEAAYLLETGRFAPFSALRPPGYSVFVAPFVALFDDFATALGLGQAILGILTSALTLLIVRPVLAPPWPALVVLFVGLDPVLLTYERYALSECLTTFTATALGWVLVTLAGRLSVEGSWRRAILVGVVLGLTCGAGTYVRANMQTMLVLSPLLLMLGCLGRASLPRSLTAAALTALVGAGLIAPWVLRNQRLFGQASFTISAWSHRLTSYTDSGVTDISQIAAFDYAKFQDLRLRKSQGTLVGLALLAEVTAAGRIEVPPGSSQPVIDELRARRVVEESASRRPLRRLYAMWVAFSNHLGLWNKHHHPLAAKNSYLSKPLRGQAGLPRNYYFSLEGLQHVHAERVVPLVRRVERDVSYVRGTLAARSFDELFWTYRFVGPLVGALFLVGLIAALLREEFRVWAVGLIALANVLGLAILQISANERYSSPFRALLAIVAIYGLTQLMQAVRRITAVRSPSGLLLE